MKFKLIFCVIALCSFLIANAQASIDGPTCVLAGVEYQYLISSDDTIGNGIQICITGGAYINNQATCLNDSIVGYVLVTWNNDVNTASLSFSSPTGNAVSAINITTPLQAGIIDTTYSSQNIGYDSSVSNIVCSAASGGNCSPSYAYQWQQSSNNLDWDDISNATNQNFDANITLKQTTYFRRKVTEINSGTIGYSNIVTVVVTQTQAILDKKQQRQKLDDSVAEINQPNNTNLFKENKAFVYLSFRNS